MARMDGAYSHMRMGALGFIIMLTAVSHVGSTQTTIRLVREPAVAGMFYPRQREPLSGMLDEFLGKASPPAENAASVRGLVCPHAGYEYSGPTAAFAYKLLKGRSGVTVILLAPSHYASFRGASVSGSQQWRTPLGLVQISPRARELASKPPFMPEGPARVSRPGWARMSPARAPEDGSDTPLTCEHAAEVQVPFMQKVLSDFTLIPVVCGDLDPGEAARALAPFVDDKTVVIASSDLSHYHPYAEARQADGTCVKAVCDMDIAKMETQEACGKAPILILMHLAREKGWVPKLLDYRNSGDTSGDKSRVVGYAAIAFSEKNMPKPAGGGPTPEKIGGGTTMTDTASTTQGKDSEPGALTHDEGKAIVELARRALTEVVKTGKLPEVDKSALPARLKEIKGCFVTLTEDGQLRGCIGHIVPREPLYQSVLDNARSAALHDTRFTPVRTEELGKIQIEVSVLTVPAPLEFKSPEDLVAKLVPNKDGVILQMGANMATYLPQVWEQLPDKVSFLSHLSQKAGCTSDAWRQPGTIVKTYHVQAFEESEFAGKK